jgi:hypothetical protein
VVRAEEMAENLTGMATRDYEAVVSGGKTGRGGSPEAKGAMDGREGVEETKGPMGTTSGHGDQTKRHSRLSYSLTRRACQTSIRLRRRSPMCLHIAFWLQLPFSQKSGMGYGDCNNLD